MEPAQLEAIRSIHQDKVLCSETMGCAVAILDKTRSVSNAVGRIVGMKRKA